ncbi:MAG: multidrug effflux MFS transporter [Solirubrobacteraceae bacterium]|nr:multidrug effflux MFS transporter [Solirubrobacteraceae bacterium]
MDMYLPGLPELSDDLATPAWAAQATVSVCMAGLAAGQIVAGPISDARGRRGPLLAGVGVFTLSSLLCALAPSIVVLLLLRLVQGLAGAAGIAIARAIVRDRHDDPAHAAREFAILTVISGVAPILAPSLGGAVLEVGDWRAIFVVLAGVGLVLWLGTWRVIPETLPRERRHGGGLAQTGRAIAVLVRDRGFVGLALACGLSFGAMAVYIAGSPFVLEHRHGIGPTVFAVVFGVNAAGLIASSWVGRTLVARVGAPALLAGGQAMQVAGGALVLVTVLAGLGLAPLLAGLFLVVSATGVLVPNATALAMADHPEIAGSASGVLGLVAFGLGAVLAPLAGVAGDSALPMAITIFAAATGGAVALRAAR